MTALALVAALALAAGPEAAAAPPPAAADVAAQVAGAVPALGPLTPTAPADGPDVELHVPRAQVQKLALEVENLQARLDLDTSVANLVRVQAGVVATVQKLKVQMDGVEAETHLVVRLQRVTEVMERALGTIDRHPDLAGAPQASATPIPAVSVDAAAAPAESKQSPHKE